MINTIEKLSLLAAIAVNAYCTTLPGEEKETSTQSKSSLCWLQLQSMPTALPYPVKRKRHQRKRQQRKRKSRSKTTLRTFLKAQIFPCNHPVIFSAMTISSQRSLARCSSLKKRHQTSIDL